MSRLADLRASASEVARRRAEELPAARRLRFALTIDALDRHADRGPLSVLDAGCGAGLLTEALARRYPTWEITGADLDEARLREGRRRVEAAGLANARFERLDLTADLPPAGYEVVLAIECLVEIPEDDAALAGMARSLRPGGLFIAHVPQEDWEPALPGSEPTWRHQVRHGYNTGGLAAKLDRAGLSVRAIEPTSRTMVRLAQELRDRLRRRSLKLQLLAYPATAAAVSLERRGIKLGAARALFVEAVRQ